MTFRVLSVCTGNICRSPIAQIVLAEALSDMGTRVESAGIGALVGHGIPDEAIRAAAERGVAASPHVARQIDVAVIQESDLILGMAREHRRYVVEMSPAAMRRSFTLLELARIADAVAPRLSDAVRGAGAETAEDGMRAAVSLAAMMRGTVAPPERPEHLDVVDPFRRSDDVYRESFDALVPAAHRVADFLRTSAEIATSREGR